MSLGRSASDRSRYHRSAVLPVVRTLGCFWLAGAVHLSARTAEAADWRDRVRTLLAHGGCYAESAQGEELFAYRADTQFIPASTLKVATSLALLKRFGPEHRFPTEFYRSPGGTLVVKGLGSPSLVSEELLEIAKKLKESFREVNGITVDTTYVDMAQGVDGVADSLNPYDAMNGALVANFNTIFVAKDARGNIRSAEPQTPLTPLAAQLGKRAKVGSERINLGHDPSRGGLYAGELLAAFLAKEGVKVNPPITSGRVLPRDTLVYRHLSSKPLREIVRLMLEYSTNFLANQLLLLLGADAHGPPATIAKGASALESYLHKDAKLPNVKVLEGAGLSRKNRFSPREMTKLVRLFEPYKDLLPVEHKIFRAKTGSLKQVSTLAGYFMTPSGKEVRFAILVNGPVPFDHKFTVAHALYDGLAKELR